MPALHLSLPLPQSLRSLYRTVHLVLSSQRVMFHAMLGTLRPSAPRKTMHQITPLWSSMPKFLRRRLSYRLLPGVWRERRGTS
jgi:hypothetical protein